MIPDNNHIDCKEPLRVLIIEDTEERQKVLTSLYRSHAWILVNTGHRAITLCNAYDFDIISLDYNLHGDLNGADVAKAIQFSRNKNVRLIVHSLNPKGVKQILNIIPTAIPYPVSKMIRSNQLFKHLKAKLMN
ncbi:CheY-like receiver domain-containing protein [Cylindrospermum stagnale PCC 7417]|uniref:CheY-like receiver domain-containing protein n=1 Tax=Cylindrospermum stagnale PCC 7417 TaxID=56107 RepID=K9WZ02_9NOST|nr:response regulator [Cylindrospermum stagnale]AFZ25575.1 CheY-like receiver domain-containing protein [Cylindrospermum stagnale PCC 7417]